MRLVLDTNVLVAAFVARGQCHELLESAVRAHQVFVSDVILEEFRRTSTGKLRVPAAAAAEAVALQLSRMRLVEPQPLPGAVCRDPEDDAILATAVAAAADLLVTGDADLLALGHYRGVRILLPADFWRVEAAGGAGATPVDGDGEAGV